MSECVPIAAENTSFVNFQYYYTYILSKGKSFSEKCNSCIIKSISKEYYSYYENDPSYLFIIDCSDKQIKKKNVGNSKIISYDSIRLNYDTPICKSKYNTLNKLKNDPSSLLKYPKTSNGSSNSSNLSEYSESLINAYTTIITQCGKIPNDLLRPHVFYSTYQLVDVNTNTLVSKTSICCICKYKNKNGKIRYTIFGTGIPLVGSC
jgi:hypothetical protein